MPTRCSDVKWCLIFVGLLFIPSVNILANELSCDQEPALLSQHWERIAPEGAPWTAGQWSLPISSLQPDILTSARLALVFVRETQNWAVRFAFTFDDPKPFGLPFTFEKARLSWDGDQGREAVELNWANECTRPGRSMFPGLGWTEDVPLEFQSESPHLPNALLELWGARR